MSARHEWSANQIAPATQPSLARRTGISNGLDPGAQSRPANLTASLRGAVEEFRPTRLALPPRGIRLTSLRIG